VWAAATDQHEIKSPFIGE